MCLIFSVIFFLLIIGNGKLSFESSTPPVLCWGFKMIFFVVCLVLDFLVGCFVVFWRKGEIGLQGLAPKVDYTFFQCLFKWKI